MGDVLQPTGNNTFGSPWYGASQLKDKVMGGNNDSPETRNINDEATATLMAQLKLQPQILGANQQYGPQYANLYNQLTNIGLFGQFDAGKFFNANPDAYKAFQDEQAAGGLQGWTPQQYAQAYADENGTDLSQYYGGGLLDAYGQSAPYLQGLQGQLNTQQRTQDITDVENLGGRAVAAFNAANPQLNMIRNLLTSRAANATGPMDMLGQADQVSGGTNYGTQALLSSTLGELAKGGSLGAGETRDITNDVLTRFNRAGRAGDRAAVAGTALGLDSAQQARLAQRQTAVGNASNLYNADLSRQLTADQSNQQYNFSTGYANQQAQLGNANYINQLLSGTGNFLAATQTDPFQAVLGRSAGLSNSMAATGQAQQGNTYQGSSQFDPFNSYAQDLYNTNYNAQSAANISGLNNQSALTGAGIGAGATILAAL